MSAASLSYDDYVAFVPRNTTAKCIKVIDASTLHLGFILPAPYGPTYFVCRLVGVGTPEIRSPNTTEKTLGRAARELTMKMTLHRDCSIRISGKDKYGRYLVRVATEECADLSDYLIAKHVAVALTDQQRKNNWDELLQQYIRTAAASTTADAEAAVTEAT